MINRMDASGFFVDEETAKEIADFLEDYNCLLESTLKTELDDDTKNEVAANSINIEEICQIFRDEKDDT